MGAVRVIDGKPAFDVAAREWCFRVALPQGGSEVVVPFVVEPPAQSDVIDLLKVWRKKYSAERGADYMRSRADKATVETEVSVFDRIFLRMLDVVGEDEQPATTEAQRSWLASHPQVKSRVVQALGAFEVVPPATEQALRVFVLSSAPKPVDIQIKLPVFDPESRGVVDLEVTHVMRQPTSEHYADYRLATDGSDMNLKRGEAWQHTDYQALLDLWIKCVVRVDGACVGEKPCGEGNIAEWVRKIPAWHRISSIEALFERVAGKNV